MRAIGAICVALWGASLAWAEIPALQVDDALPGFGPAIQVRVPCPDDVITGQSPGMCGTTQWYFYSDLGLCNGTLCGRVRADNFPPTGVLDPNDPNQRIGKITWFGVYANENGDGCTKPTNPFRIRFYDDYNGNFDPNIWVYEELVTAAATQIDFAILCFGCMPTGLFRFEAVLTTPVQMEKGWISIVAEGTPGCYFLWEGSGEGNSRFAEWWEINGSGTLSYPTTFCDLNYCLGVKVVGACCDDRSATCVEGVTEAACDAMGGRFRAHQTCSSFGSDPNDPNDYACGDAPGACCSSAGGCTILPAFPCIEGGPPPPCPGDANCDGDRDFDDIDPFVAVLAGGLPCLFENLDVNGDGVIDFDDIDPFVSNLGQPCAVPNTNLWRGAFTTCDQCCAIDCNDPNHPVTHVEQEACGQDTNSGCVPSDPNDPNSPLEPTAFEHLGVLDPNPPTVICGTLWVGQGTFDYDYYDFSLPARGTLAWTSETEDIPLHSTPIAGPDLAAPTCQTAFWSYPSVTPAKPCAPVALSPGDVFRAETTYWWFVWPDSAALFVGYPCTPNWNNYRITIRYTPVTCDPCLSTDRQEGEAACGPSYTDTFNSGCDSTDGDFHVQATIDPNYFYCAQSGTWTDPNGGTVVDADWWKIVLTGTINKRLQIQMRSAFDMRWELYSVPGNDCGNKVRLDYYEFEACDANVSVYTACLSAGAAYYMRVVPRGATSCTQFNNYRFAYSVVTEAPACTLCSVSCSSSPDDLCQVDANDPETNGGCGVVDPNSPGNYVEFVPGDNIYGPKYCGRLSTFTGVDGTPRADLDWFHFSQPAGRTKLVIRGKAMFRMSINIAASCSDPNNVTHGWDRPCKGTTTAATNAWRGLTPNTVYTGVILYGNGGGDGTNEQPLRQFFLGLPCSDNRSAYELELQAQT